MSNMFIRIYWGGRGVKFTKHFKGGGEQAIKVWEPLIYGFEHEYEVGMIFTKPQLSIDITYFLHI
jgi:hypothetical protein